MSKPFDLVKEFSRFGKARSASLAEPETLDLFGTHAIDQVAAALKDGALLHGLRAESMFGALAVTLGRVRLIRNEDSGHVYPPSGYRVADYRVVLPDGKNWLIEVKNVYEEGATASRRFMTRGYREELEAYATATGGELKLAIYWAKWSIWTLVTPARLVDAKGELSLHMLEALKASELGELGDLSLGTRSPLELHLVMDQARSSTIGPDGKVMLTIGEVKMFCGGQHLTDAAEQELAWAFMNYGDWNEQEPVPEVKDERVIKIVHRWAPEVDHDQGFEMIASLSRMFSRYCTERMVRSGDVISLEATPREGWFDALKDWDNKGLALPLWRFRLEPNFGGASRP